MDEKSRDAFPFTLQTKYLERAVLRYFQLDVVSVKEKIKKIFLQMQHILRSALPNSFVPLIFV